MTERSIIIVIFFCIAAHNTIKKMGSTDDSFCLKWNDFHTSVTASFADLRRESDLFDVTLICGDQTIMAHR